MKIFHTILDKRFYLYALALVAVGGVLAASNLDSKPASAQGTNSMYIGPTSGSYPVGSTFTISVRENSSSAVNAAEADLAYPSSLQFVSIDGSSSAFGIDASSTGGNGTVSISRGNTSPVSGDQLIAKVNFKVLATGTASIQLQGSSAALSSSTNANVVGARNGASYTLTGSSSSPTPTPPPTPSPTPSPTPGSTPPPANPSPSSSGSTRSTTSTSAVSIAPKGNSQSTALPGDSVVELSTPATVQTTPLDSKNVSKVEYYVNGKLVATVKTPPYTYSVDTTKYRNGSYTLTTKTYNKDGTISSSDASLVVKNPFGLSQILLQIRHYLWIIILVVLIVVGVLAWRKLKGTKPSADPYGRDEPVDFGPPRSTVAAPPTTSAAFTAPAPTAPTVTVEPSAAAEPKEPTSLFDSSDQMDQTERTTEPQPIKPAMPTQPPSSLATASPQPTQPLRPAQPTQPAVTPSNDGPSTPTPQ